MTQDITDYILEKYYPINELAYQILYPHSVNVCNLALKIAEQNKHLNPDFAYIRVAAMLHDIGILKTDAPGIGCFGLLPYIAHTYSGREILEKEGLSEIATICERHIGVGITIKDIKRDNLPLPLRDMTPQSIEEKIICYADKFYSKNPKKLHQIKPISKILRKIEKYGTEKEKVFRGFMELFGHKYIYD
jgi:uncharacterized protein